MQVFFDTEFIEDGQTIDLISIGMVTECGEKYYAISNEFDQGKANQWVLENVIPKLEQKASLWQSRNQIRDGILQFIGDHKPEFWAYYCSYDWVILCQLFGTMEGFPKHFPKHCNDLMQEIRRLKINFADLPSKPTEDKAHNALHDALWARDVYYAIEEQQS